VTAGSPRILDGKYFTASGSSRKLKIWTLFSDSDPNHRLNVGNHFGVELWKETYSPEKLGTGRTWRMPRVWIHPWPNRDPSKNLGKGRFSDLRRSSPCRTTDTAFANEKVKTRRKLGYPDENLTFQDGGLQCWRDASGIHFCFRCWRYFLSRLVCCRIYVCRRYWRLYLKIRNPSVLSHLLRGR